MALRCEDDDYQVKMWEYSSSSRTTSSNSMSKDVTMTMKTTQKQFCFSAYFTKNTRLFSQCSLAILLLFIVIPNQVAASDPVYVRSGDFGQLVTSSTSRWFKGIAKDPFMLKKSTGGTGIICRVYHTTLRGVGLVSDEAEGSICNIDTQEGAQGSDKFQTISETASRLVWTQWKRPNPPPTGAVAISTKPLKFLAADLNSTVIGYLDPTLHLGSAMFPNQAEPSGSCLILTEIEPIRYELSDIQLKRNKGFIEEDIVLAYGKLFYEEDFMKPSDDWDSSSLSFDRGDKLKSESTNDPTKEIIEPKRGRVESILSYETNTYDYWGQGNSMAKGLHTTIHLPDGSTKVYEWGLPFTQAGKTETMTAVADLLPGTGINVTLHGTRLNGEMSYWATLKTFFKDGSSSTRLTDNHRKVIEIQDIRLEHSKPYFLSNNSIVPEPPTTTTTTTASPTLPTAVPTTAEEEETDGTEEEGNALPVESSPHNIQADQSLHLMAHNNIKSDATSVALSHTSSLWWKSSFYLSITFIFSLHTATLFPYRFLA